MDTSKEYVKMCSEAPEIQALHKPEEGDFYCNGGFKGSIYHENPGPVKVCCGVQQDEKCVVTLCGPHNNWETDGDRANRVWLPRQDQLQEMVIRWGKDPKPEYWPLLLFGFVDWSKNYALITERYMKEPCPFPDTLEKLWFSFVMHDKYKKMWNGEEWIDDSTTIPA